MRHHRILAAAATAVAGTTLGLFMTGIAARADEPEGPPPAPASSVLAGETLSLTLPGLGSVSLTFNATGGIASAVITPLSGVTVSEKEIEARSVSAEFTSANGTVEVDISVHGGTVSVEQSRENEQAKENENEQGEENENEQAEENEGAHCQAHSDHESAQGEKHESAEAEESHPCPPPAHSDHESEEGAEHEHATTTTTHPHSDHESEEGAEHEHEHSTTAAPAKCSSSDRDDCRR